MKLIGLNEKRDMPSDQLGSSLSLRDAVDRLFDESIWSPFALSKDMQSFAPCVDVSETDKEVKIRADIPGVDPERVNIEITEDSVTLSGSMEKSEEEKRENYYQMERSSGQFSREFMFPSTIDPDSAEAKSKNGVISITLKKQQSDQKRKVQVQVER